MSEGSMHDPSKTTKNLLTDDRDRVLHPILFAGGDAWLYDWPACQTYDRLAKMEKDGIIRFVREEDKRKIYHITPLGQEILACELQRIERLYNNSKGRK